MDFNFAQIDILIKRGLLSKDKINTFGISSCSKGDNYSNHFINYNDDGSISESGFYPINVDCDDGSYDTRYYDAKYASFDDFIANKPLESKTHRD